MRGWVFLPLTARPPKTLRGEGGRTIIAPILRILGGGIPLGLGSRGVGGIGSPILGSLAGLARGVKGAGGGGDTPTGWIP